MIHALEERYRQDLRNEMNELTDAVITSENMSIEAIRHMQGVVKGLAIAERFFLDRAAQLKEASYD